MYVQKFMYVNFQPVWCTWEKYFFQQVFHLHGDESNQLSATKALKIKPHKLILQNFVSKNSLFHCSKMKRNKSNCIG